MHKCEKCKKYFKTKYSLQRHLNKKIPCTIEKLQCHRCNQLFNSRSTLCRHRKICTKNIENRIIINTPFTCKYCHKNCKHRTHMYRHIRNHCNIKELFEEPNSYGDENMEWIKRNILNIVDESSNCESLEDFIEFSFKKLHFNDHVLENRNIKVNNKRDFFERDIISIYQNHQWKLVNNKKIVHHSTQKFVQCLEESLVDIKKNNHLLIDNLPNMNTLLDLMDKFDDNYSFSNNKLPPKLKPKLFIMIDNNSNRSLASALDIS